MEKFPIVRRLPKRVVLCLYLICAMLAACALFTLYLDEGGTPTTTIHNVIVTDEVNLDISSSSNSSDHKNAKRVVSTGWSWARQYKISSENDSDSARKQASVLDGTRSIPSKHHTSFHDNTKYIYLTTKSTTTTSISPRATHGMISSGSTARAPATPSTCDSPRRKDSKLILLWTSFFDNWNYLPKDHFAQCQHCRNCRVTKDRSKLLESDAVIFHARDMSVSDLPSIRYPHQRWVFYCLESPPYSDFPGLQHMRSMFNWTMTYRTDSDILAQYGSVSKIRPSHKIDLEALRWTFGNKTKSVVWMSSHCPTHGGRDAYVAELRKYIDVDVYGTCGSSVCPPGDTNKCLQEYAAKYKFFLAFENAVCKDYITEKFYRTLKFDIVPVVFGGAVYSKFAPPASYIDALSFKSPKHLAFFLTGVAKDFKLYSGYFMWRKDYSVRLRNQKECILCSLLHRTDVRPSSYADLRSWWVNDSNCKSWKPKR